MANINVVLDKEVKESRASLLRDKPWWSPSHDLINDFLKSIVKGSHLVSNPCDKDEISNFDPSNTLIIQSNKNNTQLNIMEMSRCHDNCDILLSNGTINEYHTGFALSKDGLWRHHSWGVTSNGVIIETTMSRLVYVSVTIRKMHSM